MPIWVKRKSKFITVVLILVLTYLFFVFIYTPKNTLDKMDGLKSIISEQTNSKRFIDLQFMPLINDPSFKQSVQVLVSEDLPSKNYDVQLYQDKNKIGSKFSIDPSCINKNEIKVPINYLKNIERFNSIELSTDSTTKKYEIDQIYFEAIDISKYEKSTSVCYLGTGQSETNDNSVFGKYKFECTNIADYDFMLVYPKMLKNYISKDSIHISDIKAKEFAFNLSIDKEKISQSKFDTLAFDLWLIAKDKKTKKEYIINKMYVPLVYMSYKKSEFYE